MGIKPALGWLGLLLFTTAAQAEGPRDLRGSTKSAAPLSAPVTVKTKAPAPVAVVAQTTTAALSVVESIGKPRFDYEAETYAGVPLDSPSAKERGFDKGLVLMAFEHRRAAGFRVARDRIKRVVRLAVEERAMIASAGKPRPTRERIDVLETEDGVIAVETVTMNGGLFTSSAVYVFPRNAALEQRVGALEGLAAPVRDRLREALVAAEWAH